MAVDRMLVPGGGGPRGDPRLFGVIASVIVFKYYILLFISSTFMDECLFIYIHGRILSI